MRNTVARSWVFALNLMVVLSLISGERCLAETLGGTLRLTLGQQRVLDVTAPLEQVAIGDPTVVDVKVISEGRQVLITAIGKGTTDLLTWDLAGKQKTTLVHVILKDIRLIRDEVRGMLGAIEGVHVRMVGERVVIDGEVFTRKDHDRIQKIATVYPREVTVLIGMSASVSRLIALEITKSLHKNGYLDVRAEGIGEKIFLEGTVVRKDDLKEIRVLAEAYYEDCVSLVRLAGHVEDLVLIDIQFVEVGKRLAEKLGVNWDDMARFEISSFDRSINILRGAPDKSSMNLSLADGFGATIELQQGDSYARTLAHPRLICKSGQKAEFVAGGEIPIALILADRFAVEYKDYGIMLDISPVVHRDSRISASVEAQSSTLDHSLQVAGYPGIKKRSVSTYVTLEENKVLALSGLVNQTDSKDVERMPVIGNFPILGELFKSRHFNNDDTELVIFLSARLMKPESDLNKEMIEAVQQKYENSDENLSPLLFD